MGLGEEAGEEVEGHFLGRVEWGMWLCEGWCGGMWEGCVVVGCEMSGGDGERGKGEFVRVLIVRGEEGERVVVR